MCSQVEISNINSSIRCRVLIFGTHEKELEPILLTNFQQKVLSLFYTLLEVLVVVFQFVSFCVFVLTGWQNRDNIL